MPYLNEVQSKLTTLLEQTPPLDQLPERAECVIVTNGKLSVDPHRATSLEAFARILMSDPWMISLVKADKHRLAMRAQTPSELVMNLLRTTEAQRRPQFLQ